MDKIKNTNRHYYLAKAYFAAGMFGRALDEFDKALKFSPEFANIHYDAAKTYEKMELFGNAAKEYKIALDINPHYADAKESLAKLLSGNRDKKLKIKKRFPVKKAIKIFSAVFSVGVIVFTIYYFARPRPQSIAYFSVPSLHPSGITISDKEVWICDWFSSTVYKHKFDVALSLIKSTKLSDIHPAGIASNKKELWLCDAFAKKIFQFDKNTMKVSGSYPSPGANPSAIFLEGKFLWSCDSQDDKIYRHRKDKNLTIDLECSLSNPNAVGLAVIGKNIFVADADTGMVHRYFLDEKAKKISQLSEYEIPAFGTSATAAITRKISGLSMTSDELFLTSEGTGEVYRIPFKMLKSK